jgi:hypothetical protein
MLWVLGLYSVCRAYFVYTYRSQLELDHVYDVVRLMLGGMRFDLSAIAISNGLFLLLTLSPHPYSHRPGFRKITHFIFIAFNGICLLANVIDLAYFEFVHKRTQADALLFVSGAKGNDLYRLMPVFLQRY